MRLACGEDARGIEQRDEEPASGSEEDRGQEVHRACLPTMPMRMITTTEPNTTQVA